MEDVEEIDQDVGDNFTPTALTQPGKLSQPQPLFSSTNKLNNFLAGLGLPGTLVIILLTLPTVFVMPIILLKIAY